MVMDTNTTGARVTGRSLLTLATCCCCCTTAAKLCHTIATPSAKTFHPTHHDHPILLKGAATHWPAQTTWTASFLTTALHHVNFPHGNLSTILNNPNKYLFSKIHPHTGQLITDPPNQSTFLPLQHVDQLLPLFNGWYSNARSQQMVHHFLLVGGLHSGLAFHNHQHGAWNGLVLGQKEWFLFPPTIDTLSIDPTGAFPTWWTDNTAVGRRRFVESIVPRLNNNITICVQEKGDVLFVPNKWHHMVVNRGRINVGINAIHDTSRNVYSEL